MSKLVSSSAALPIAHVLLRFLVVLNWLGGAAILVLLVAMPTERWIMSALELRPGPVSTPAHPVDVDAGFSMSGWLAVLLTFLLARVFAEGARMREDLEGTV